MTIKPMFIQSVSWESHLLWGSTFSLLCPSVGIVSLGRLGIVTLFNLWF